MKKIILITGLLITNIFAMPEYLSSYMSETDKVIWSKVDKTTQQKAINRFNGGRSSFRDTGMYIDYTHPEHVCKAICEFNPSDNFKKCVKRIETIDKREKDKIELERKKVESKQNAEIDKIMKRKLGDLYNLYKKLSDSQFRRIFRIGRERLKIADNDIKCYIVDINNNWYDRLSYYWLDWNEVIGELKLVVKLSKEYPKESLEFHINNLNVARVQLLENLTHVNKITISKVITKNKETIVLTEDAKVIGLKNKIVITKENIKVNASETSTIKFLIGDLEETVTIDESNFKNVYWVENGKLQIGKIN